MLNLLPIALVLVLLLLGVWLGHRRWIEPRGGLLGFPSRLLLVLLVGTLVAGVFAGAYSWAGGLGYFYRVPPLAGRMLGASAWGLAAACYLALQRPTSRRLRSALILLTAYEGLLTIAIGLLEPDRILAPPAAGRAFLAGLVGGLVILILFLIRQPLVLPNGVADYRRSSGRLLGVTALAAVVHILWGAGLYIVADGPLPRIWIWPEDSLAGRLVGSALLALGAGALASLRTEDAARMMLAALAAFGLGTLVATAWSFLLGEALELAYLVGFGILGGLALAVRSWRGPVSASDGGP